MIPPFSRNVKIMENVSRKKVSPTSQGYTRNKKASHRSNVIDMEHARIEKVRVSRDEELRNNILLYVSSHQNVPDTKYQYQLSKLLSVVECTETGNAIRFHARYGSMFHWVAKWNMWYYWNGRVWVEDDKSLIMLYAKKVAASLELEGDLIPLPTDEQGELLAYPTVSIVDKPTPEQSAIAAQFQEREEKVTALKKWAKQSRGRRALEAMIELLKDEQGITILPSELDTHPHLVACLNGVLDLHTRELLPHDRQRIITKSVSVAYNPDADCLSWKNFLLTAMSGKQDTVEYIRCLLGLGLSAESLEDTLAIFYGGGGNGKTVFLEVVKEILSTYAATANSELFLEKQSEGISNDVARLVNVRFLAASETKEGRQLDEALVKELTGGDTKTARFLRKEFFEFKPTFTPILLTNHKPIIKGIDNGIWRRIRLVPWVYNFEESPERKDKSTVLSELRTEHEGIFAWIVEGYRRRYEHGRMEVPAEVTEATNQYRSDSDLLGQFLNACCVTQKGLPSLKHAILYNAYKEHCEGNGNNPFASNKLAQKMIERGFEGTIGNGARYWYGIRMKTDDELLSEEDDVPRDEQDSTEEDDVL